MTLSREKRAKRKKNIFFRAINRLSRINIIKRVRDLLEVEIHLPFSVTQIVKDSCISVKDNIRKIKDSFTKIEVKQIDSEGNSAIRIAELENRPKLKSDYENEDIIVTPYGTFSKYKQDELLDQYELDSNVEKLIIEPENNIIDTIEALDENQLIIGDKFKNLDLEQDQKQNPENSKIEVVDAKIVMLSFSNKSQEIGMQAVKAISKAVASSFKIIGKMLLWTINLTYKPFVWIAKGVYRLVPEKFRYKENSESKFALLMVKFIDKLDDKFGMLEATLDKVESIVKSLINDVWNIRLIIYKHYKQTKSKIINLYEKAIEYTFHNKGKVLSTASAIFLSFIALGLFIGSITAYEYAYNGKVLGIVKNQNDVYVTVDVIGDKLAKEYKANIIIDKEKNISFNKVIGFDLKLDSREDVLNSFTYLKDMEVQAYAILVDGKQVATIDNKETAASLLIAIQNKYLKQSDKIKYDKVGFAERVEVKPISTKIGKLQEKDEVLKFMLTGALQEKIHTVQKGETFSGIASSYGVKQSQLMASNPGIIPEKLKIGQAIVLTAAVPVLTVQTSETAKYIVPIPFTIEYENTEAKYKGEQSVKSRGVNGQKEVVAKIVRNNGVEVTRTELSSVILADPKSQVVLVGTKKLPPLVGTGTFISPVRGTITSRFGYRWGRLHTGVDIGVHTGTEVKAADGGRVIFSGRDGSLGICIRIDHGGNRVTTYGHLSKSLVKAGQKVFQGQHIANSGNTGRSTGPHLHFEIQINGKFKNPLNYI
jgi:murein DD-endopeptidase MepM/ murein hydrolase activator NlpD